MPYRTALLGMGLQEGEREKIVSNIYCQNRKRLFEKFQQYRSRQDNNWTNISGWRTI